MSRYANNAILTVRGYIEEITTSDEKIINKLRTLRRKATIMPMQLSLLHELDSRLQRIRKAIIFSELSEKEKEAMRTKRVNAIESARKYHRDFFEHMKAKKEMKIKTRIEAKMKAVEAYKRMIGEK